jgi:hypothetical protein
MAEHEATQQWIRANIRDHHLAPAGAATGTEGGGTGKKAHRPGP